ncbi:hypothetical protein L9F63_025787, partial [Diploptera punctata]
FSRVNVGLTHFQTFYRENIKSEVTNIPTFRQTGYTVTFVSSHDTQLQWLDSAASGNLAVKRGTTRSCVSAAGTYDFTPVGCHGFAQPSVRWNSATTPPTPVRLIAVSHSMGGRVLSTENVKDMFINVLSEDGKLKTRLGPLTGKPGADGKMAYNFELMVSEGENLMLEPTAGTLLFSPRTRII